MLKFALPFLAVALVEAISVFAASPANAADSLAGSEWGMDGKDLPNLRFEDGGRVTGNGGCNRFFGRYETGDEGLLKFGMLASTKMACDDLAGETQFLQQLESVRRFRLDGIRLSLADEAGQQVLNLVRRDAD